MDNLKKLHSVLVRDGYTNKSFDEFIDQATQDAEYQDKIYNVVSRENLFGGSPDEFAEKYFSELAASPVEGVKKKDDFQPTGEEEVMVSDTEVVEQPGSSGPSAQINPNQPEEVVDERVTEEIQDPETLQAVQQIQEVPNRTGADNVYLEDAIDTRDYSTTGEENTDLEDFFGKNFLTDFLGDIYRAGAQGQAQGGSIDESLELFVKGKDVTDEDIQDFIIAQEKMANAGQSDEMRDFNKIYQSDGGGWWGFIKGVAANPSIIPQLFVSSVSAMVNPTVLAAAGAGAATGAAIGSTGFSGGPLGVFTTAGGAIAGAMGAAGGTLETGLTFAELLLEQLDGKPMTKENVREILESDEKMQGIRFKSAGRGFAIGMVDAISAGVASKVTAKVAGLTGRKLVAATAGGAVEAIGGSTGEVAGRLVAGQDMDIAEIGFEGIAGTATAPITVGYGLYKAPKYYINKQNGGEVARVSGPEMAKFIRESSPTDLAGATLTIENDPELKSLAEERTINIKQDAAIIKQLKEAGITDDASINKLVELEKQKEKLSGNTTRAGKLKLKEIDAKIDDVMNGIDVDITQTTDDQGNTTTETVVITKEYARKKLMEEGVDFPVQEQIEAKQAQLMEEGEAAILEMKKDQVEVTDQEVLDTIDKDTYTDEEFKIAKELLIKEKKDAIQESSTESVDVQEQTIDSQELGEGNTPGDPTTESQDSETDTEAPTQEEVEPATPEEFREASRDLNDLINDNDVTVEGVEVETTESRPLKEKIKNIVDKIADAKNGFSQKWFNPSVMERAGITTDEDVKEYYIQSIENGEVVNDANKDFINSEFERLGIDPIDIQNTTTEAVSIDDNGNLKIIESMEGSQITLPGQQIDNTLSVTEKTDNKTDDHYSSDTFTEENPNTTIEQHESKIIKIAKKATSAIVKLLPNTKIVIHRSEAAYNKFVTGKGTRGTFDPNTNTIHINMPKANGKTIAHEIFHAVLYDKFGSDAKIAEITKRMFDAVNRKITDKKLKKELQDFSDRYSEFQNEEYLSELVGILADNYPSLSAPEKSIIKRWLVKLGSMIGISPEVDTDADVLDLLDTIGKSVKEGKEISTEDMSALNAVDKLNTEDKLQQQEDYEAAMDERREDIKKMNNLPSGMNAWLAENLGKVHVDDFNQNSDRNNISKDKREGLNKLLRKTGPRDIDMINDPFNDDGLAYLDPEVIVEYLLDRADNPGKYSARNINKARSMGMTRDQKMQKSGPTTINKLNKFYKMDKNGFIDTQNVYDLNSLDEWAAKLGYKVDRSRGDKGETTKYYLRNKQTDKKFTPTTAQRQQIVFTKSETPVSIITKARELGFNNPEIKDVLIANTDLKASEISTLLKVPFKELKNLPESFINVKGGIKKGLATFKNINEFITDLNKKNQKLENPLTQEQLAIKAIDKLQTTEAYKNSADFIKVKGELKAKATPSTQQLQMEVAVRESFDVKPTKDAAKTLRTLKSKITDRLKGMRDIQKIKKELRNFIRQSLPNDQYTKANVLKMVRFVANLTTKELTGPQLRTTMLKIQNFVTDKNITNLKAKKDLLLDVSKYEKKESGLLKGKIVSADVKSRIKKIAESQPGPSTTAKEIQSLMEAWTKEINDISEQTVQTDGDLSRMADLEIMINLSNSNLMDGAKIPSIHQVSVLDKATNALQSLIQDGRSDLRQELAANRKVALKEMQDVYNDMTGENVDLVPKKFTIKDAEKALKEDGITDPTDIQIADKITELQDQNATEIQSIVDKVQEDFDINDNRIDDQVNDNILKKGWRTITGGITNFLNRAESLQGLMDIISEGPGKMLGGVAQKLVYKKINASSIEYKARMIVIQNKITDKMSEIYGKGWKKIARKNAGPVGTGVYRNPKPVIEAQKVYDENPTRKNKKKLTQAKKDQEIVMSPNQIYYQYNQFQDPANKKSFMSDLNRQFKNDPDRIMQELYDSLSEENKQWAQWQRDEFFPELYEYYNETYKKIYRTDMPWNEFYAGRIHRTGSDGKGMTNVDPLNLTGDASQFGTSVGASSTKSRVDNAIPIAYMDGNDTMMSYLTDMEWFAAYAENVRGISKLINNKNIKKTIEVKHGADMNLLIKASIDKIASRGINTQAGNNFVNTFNDIFITSRLGLNPTVMLKQLTSMPTYANSIGPINYAKYAIKNKVEMLKVYKEIRDNSVYMQDRGFSDMKKTIESYNNKQTTSFLPQGLKSKFGYFSEFMMVTTKIGDRAAIYLGGMPNYSYYKAEFQKKNPKATEQQAIDYAIRKFELDTKSTQQSMDLQDKDYFQSGDPLHRAFNMFMTTPKQYFRQERGAFRQLWRKTKNWDRKSGKGTLGENLRTLAMYHVVMPALFQYVALGLPGMMRDKTDEDDQDLLRSVILGNFNALFIVGDMLTMGFDKLRGKPWAETAPSLPALEMMAEINRLSTRMSVTKDPELKQEYANKLTTKILDLSSLPATNLNKLYKNYEKLVDGNVDDPGEAFLRAFNYSDYMIEGQVTPPTKDDMDQLKKTNLQAWKIAYPAWERKYGRKKKTSAYDEYKKNPQAWKVSNPGKKIPNRR